MGRPKSGERVRGPYHDKSRARWRVDEFDPGESKPTCSYFPREEDAADYIKARRAAESAKVRTTQEAVPYYERHLRDKGDRENSIVTMRYALLQFFPEPVVLATLTPARCQALYDDLRTRPKKVQVGGKRIRPDVGPPMSVDSHRGALNYATSFLKWCASKGWLAENPLEEIKGVGRKRHRGKSLGKEGRRVRIREARVLYAKTVEMAHAGDQRAAIVLTAILCGLRASEIIRLRVRDLDDDELPGDVIHVEDRKNGEDLELEVHEDLRVVFLALAADRPPEAPLFAHEEGGKFHGLAFDRRYVRDCVHRVCEAAGVAPMTAHACRGLLATVSAERGMAGRLVAATLGNDERVMGTSYAAPGALASGARRRGLAVLQGGKR